MPLAAKSNGVNKFLGSPHVQNALGLLIGSYLVISLIATMFGVESAWTWPIDILDLFSHMVAGHCIYPGSHA